MSTSRLYTTLQSIAILIGFGLFCSACSTNAATGRLQWDRMSTKDEIALGEKAMPELTKEYGGMVNDDVLRDYVESIGLSMAEFTEADNPDLPWEFTLLDSDVINAFALPGGKVFLSRGLMTKMNSEAELAGVIGHEIGHVTAQHTDDRLTQSMILAGLVIASGVATSNSDSDLERAVPLVVGAGGQGYLLSFGRDQELEADRLGMRYMRRAGYDPRGQLLVMKILKQSADEAGSNPPEWLSTHPHPETRIKAIRNLLKTDYKATQGNPAYSMYEDRFQSTARARLDALDKEAKIHGELPRGAFDNDIATLLFDATPSEWCNHCAM